MDAVTHYTMFNVALCSSSPLASSASLHEEYSQLQLWLRACAGPTGVLKRKTFFEKALTVAQLHSCTRED